MLTPAPALSEYPTVIDFPPPRLYGYSRETAIAEKFEAMVKLGQINSRMKDFFDIWSLSRQFAFDSSLLTDAIARTFAQRKTVLEFPPHAFTEAFSLDGQKTAQWNAFLRRSRLLPPPGDLSEIVHALAEFLLPVASAIRDKQPMNAHWDPPGPWR